MLVRSGTVFVPGPDVASRRRHRTSALVGWDLRERDRTAARGRFARRAAAILAGVLGSTVPVRTNHGLSTRLASFEVPLDRRVRPCGRRSMVSFVKSRLMRVGVRRRGREATSGPGTTTVPDRICMPARKPRGAYATRKTSPGTLERLAPFAAPRPAAAATRDPRATRPLRPPRSRCRRSRATRRARERTGRPRG